MVLLSILKEKRKIILENICMIRIHIFFLPDMNMKDKNIKINNT